MNKKNFTKIAKDLIELEIKSIKNIILKKNDKVEIVHFIGGG